MTTNQPLQIRTSLIKGIHIPKKQLICLSKRFQRLVQLLSWIFYSLAAAQLITGSLAVVSHAHEDDGLFGDADTIKIEGIVFACLTELIAGFLIIVPVHSSLVQCKMAMMIANEHLFDNDPIPIKTLRLLTQTNTLCFRNPFSYKDCIELKGKIEINKKIEVKSSIKNIKSDSIRPIV
jgi:hypothetical protein